MSIKFRRLSLIPLWVKGAFDGNDKAYTGNAPDARHKDLLYLGVMESDLLIVIGARFSDRVMGNPKTFAKNSKIIHIDVDAAEINKNIRVDCSIIGDAKVVLKQLNARLEQLDHIEWMNHIYEMKHRYLLTYNKEALTGPAVVEAIYRVTGGDAIICTEVGQHQMWAAQFFKYDRPRKLLTSGGLERWALDSGLPWAQSADARISLCLTLQVTAVFV